MIRRHHGWCSLLSLFVAIGLVVPGCSGGGDDVPREAISGTVTLDGQPLAKGAIQFTPAGGTASATGAVIQNGRFYTDREHGLVPGSYKVAVNAAASTGTEPQAKPPEPGRPRSVKPKELIPKKYNAESTLTAEVKEGGPNDFKFDLQSK